MTKYFFLLISVSMMTLLPSCKSDSNTSIEDDDAIIQSDASPEEQAEAILQQKENETESLDSITQVENLVEVELEEVYVDKEKKAAEKKKILEEQLKKSPNKGKNCEDILKEYEELVNKFLQGGGANALSELAAWSNDPVFNTCKKDPNFKDRFMAIENKLEED